MIAALNVRTKDTETGEDLDEQPEEGSGGHFSPIVRFFFLPAHTSIGTWRAFHSLGLLVIMGRCSKVQGATGGDG